MKAAEDSRTPRRFASEGLNAFPPGFGVRLSSAALALHFQLHRSRRTRIPLKTQSHRSSLQHDARIADQRVHTRADAGRIGRVIFFWHAGVIRRSRAERKTLKNQRYCLRMRDA